MLGLAAAALVATIQAAPTASVPFQLVDNRIIVQVRLDGAGPFSMIVDTGSSGTGITPQTARRLHLAAKNAGYIGGAGSGRSPVATTTIPSVAIGNATFRREPALVVNLDSIRNNIGFPHLDGIIGYDVLRNFRVRVDMDRQTLTLAVRPLPAPPSARSVGFTVSDGLIYVPAAIDGIAGTVLLDTGDRSSVTVFKPFALANAFFDTTPAARNVLTGFGAGGPVYSDVFRTRISLFGANLPSIVTRASRDRGGVFATSLQAGSIGTGVLKRFNLIYDYPNHRITASPSRYFQVADRYDNAGMWLSQNSHDAYVAAVTSDGPAQRAGIHTGDRIVSVAGRSGDSALQLREWLLAQPDGAQVSIVTRAPSGQRTSHELVLHDPTVPSGAALPRHAIFGASLLEKPAGVTIGTVLPGSPAASAGVMAGDVIQSIANVRTPDVASFLAMMHELRAGSDVQLAIVRNNAPVLLHVRLAAAPDEQDPQVTTIYGAIDVEDSLRRTLLTVPRNTTTRQPGVLIIGGIGCYPVDVASNTEDPYLRLTHDLSRGGFVTMRLEKSGVADSQGPPCRDVDFAAESESYADALDALKRDPHVDPKRIYLIGHSIGSIIAPRLALSNPVAGVIVVAAVGRDWPEYELRNTRRQLELGDTPPAAVDTNMMQKASCMQRLLVEREPEAQIERTMPYCKVPNGVYPVTASYVQQVAALNIIEPWTQLRVPVLAIYGTSDFVTEEADHRRIVDVVNGVHVGQATLTIIPGMDHYLARAPSRNISLDNAQNGKREPYDDDLSRAVLAWLSSH